MMINQRGDIVGFANASAADDTNFNPRAVAWIGDLRIRNLGTLPGDANSQALGINERRQVVGQSCDAEDNCRAFVWQNGVMRDLNELAPGDDLLIAANDIDDFGRITGQGFDDESGEFFAFLATPLLD
jgi:probable HAF family extracellular repeat protein